MFQEAIALKLRTLSDAFQLHTSHLSTGRCPRKIPRNRNHFKLMHKRKCLDIQIPHLITLCPPTRRISTPQSNQNCGNNYLRYTIACKSHPNNIHITLPYMAKPPRHSPTLHPLKNNHLVPTQYLLHISSMDQSNRHPRMERHKITTKQIAKNYKSTSGKYQTTILNSKSYQKNVLISFNYKKLPPIHL